MPTGEAGNQKSFRLSPILTRPPYLGASQCGREHVAEVARAEPRAELEVGRLEAAAQEGVDGGEHVEVDQAGDGAYGGGDEAMIIGS